MRTITTIGDGFEKDLSDFIEKYLSDEFKKRNIGLYSKQCGPGLGAIMTFNSSEMLINVINEKSRIEITLGTINDNKKSWDLYLIKSHLDFKNNSDTKDKKERRKVLIFNWDGQQSAKFLLENFDKINGLFKEDKYYETKKELEIIKRERGKMMWSNN